MANTPVILQSCTEPSISSLIAWLVNRAPVGEQQFPRFLYDLYRKVQNVEHNGRSFAQMQGPLNAALNLVVVDSRNVFLHIKASHFAEVIRFLLI